METIYIYFVNFKYKSSAPLASGIDTRAEP